MSTALTSNRTAQDRDRLCPDLLLAQSVAHDVTRTAYELIIEGESYWRGHETKDQPPPAQRRAR